MTAADKKKTVDGPCETCAYYSYDEEYQEWFCDMDMDEDDWQRVMSSLSRGCPYYRNGDEYRVVRHQI